MSDTTPKDDLYIEAKEKYDIKLDRRLSLSDLEDQMERIRKNGGEKKEKPPERIPMRVRNVITGNEFDYDPIFAKNADLEVIEWSAA